ncbi:MAG: SufS family cysteine desulfurase [Bacteroidales bacterium]|nr:SufS family cysteine desulfurase [Bacteroidales bacterium]
MTDISDIRREFPALEQSVNGKPLVYLDNGATSHKPKSVIDLINEMNSRTNGNIHRAVHELSARTTALYEGAREDVMRFINARHREEIIFTSGTTASVNLVANSFSASHLKKGDSVLISQSEHHSNIVPWQMACERYGATLKVLPIDDEGNWRMDLLDSMLTSEVKIVAVAHISNVLGIVNPVEELVSRCHNRGIPVFIDGAQGIVHSSVDVTALDCDFYAFSGHKMYAATGIGVLYGKKDILEEMQPWMGGGDMVSSVTFEKTTYAALPLKFEAGTPNFIGAASLGQAIKFIENIDHTLLLENEKRIVEFMRDRLIKIDGLKLYGNVDNKIPLFSLSIKGAHPSDVAMIMDKMGVALRSGQMCSEPLMKRFNTESMLRASFAMYNTLDEAQYFIDCLKRAIKMLV